MKKILISLSVVIIVVVVAVLSIFGFNKYSEFDNSAKIKVIADKITEIAKYESKIRSFNVDGEIIEGTCGFQNGFGAWSNDEFKAKVEKIDGSYKLIALFINEGQQKEYIFDTRKDAVDARKKIAEFKKIPALIKDLKETGSSDSSPEVKNLMDYYEKLKKEIPDLVEKTLL